MSFTVIATELMVAISAIGMVASANAGTILGMIDAKLEDDLSTGTTQMVMAVFILILIGSIITLFTILMKTIDKGHRERDSRESRFSELITRMELALQANTTASNEAAKTMRECTDAMEDMSRMGTVCREHVMRHDIEQQLSQHSKG